MKKHTEKEPVARDLGIVDEFEERQIFRFLDPEGDTAADRLVGHMLRLARRDVASVTALNAARKMSRQKQSLMLLLAFRSITPSAWGAFRAKFELLKEKSVQIVRLNLALPFAKTPAVKKGYLDLLKSHL